MGKGNPSKVQSAMDTAVAVTVSEMNESEATAFLARVRYQIDHFLKTDDLDEDDKALLEKYYEALARMCAEARDFRSRPQRH